MFTPAFTQHKKIRFIVALENNCLSPAGQSEHVKI